MLGQHCIDGLVVLYHEQDEPQDQDEECHALFDHSVDVVLGEDVGARLVGSHAVADVAEAEVEGGGIDVEDQHSSSGADKVPYQANLCVRREG